MKFSKNEKMILWGLVRCPTLNDRQLAEKIGVRMSTLNAIKNKMKRAGMINDKIIPNIEIMDYEILSVIWTPLTTNTPVRKDIKSLADVFKSYPNTYTIMVFGNTLFMLSLYENYTQYRRAQFSQERELKGLELISGENIHTTLYPLSMSTMNKNFDYSSVLDNAFNINLDRHKRGGLPRDRYKEARDKIHHLTKKEKIILKGIIQSPDMPDNKIASKLDTTRQAVARHKKELIDLGVIQKTKEIDYRLPGFKILTLVEAHYTRKDPNSKPYPNADFLNLPSFFSIYGNSEAVSLSLFLDFEQYSSSKEKYISVMKGFCTWSEEPFINLYSPSDTITIKHQEYLPLVERFLEKN